MNKQDIQERANSVLENMENDTERLYDCLTEVCTGGQSLEYLDAIYAAIRDSAEELNKLANAYQELKGEAE